MSNASGKWKEWSGENVSWISLAYSKRLRRIYHLLREYPAFLGLGCPVSELLDRMADVRAYLDHHQEEEYWNRQE